MPPPPPAAPSPQIALRPPAEPAPAAREAAAPPAPVEPAPAAPPPAAVAPAPAAPSLVAPAPPPEPGKGSVLASPWLWIAVGAVVAAGVTVLLVARNPSYPSGSLGTANGN
jgi:hypothetical protein